ncbi:hypothetical protein ACFVZM_25060 [Streptomyces sioyaensis]
MTTHCAGAEDSSNGQASALESTSAFGINIDIDIDIDERVS